MSPDRETWAAGMAAVHREAAGLMEIRIVMLPDVAALTVEAHCGSVEAYGVLQGVSHALSQIQGAPRNRPALCGCCSRSLRKARFNFVVAQPANQPTPAHRLAMAICGRCGTDRETVRAAGVRALREVWPDSRPVNVTHQTGGRA